MYLFTNKDVEKVLCVTSFSCTEESPSSHKALAYRKELEKKLKTKVVAWTLMGGENENPELLKRLP